MILTDEIKNSVPHQYATDVLSGKITTGKYVKLQVQRYFQWIENADTDDYYIDHNAGMAAVNFFPKCLNHTKGKLAGQPFHLAPFQQFTIYNIFAWKNKKTGYRRINSVYDKRAKKNGKTAEMAGLVLFAMALDGEASAEIYIGATKEEQAKLCWEQAAAYINHPAFKNPILEMIGFRTMQSRIIFEPLKGFARALGGDSKTQDGINAHVGIIDEYHAHRDDTVKENLESSMVQRAQPILYHITTAGSNKHGVCKAYEDTCKDILDGHKKDDTLWIMIHDLDDDDDWEDETVWQKANPLLGQGLSIESIRKEYTKAKNQPSKLPNFLTKHLNQWVDADVVWIQDSDWLKNKDKVKLANFLKYGCAGGLDLSSNVDLTAYAFISNPDLDGFRDLLVLVFCPKDTIDSRSKEEGVPYRTWSDTDYTDFVDLSGTEFEQLPGVSGEPLKILTATDGNVIDHDVIADLGLNYAQMLKPMWTFYDRKFSDYLVNIFVSRGIDLHPFSQVTSHYSYPTKEFEKLILSGKLRHGGNPLLRYCLSGATPVIDSNENVRLDKSKSTKRIDPIIASIMAMAATITEDDDTKGKYSREINESELYF